MADNTNQNTFKTRDAALLFRNPDEFEDLLYAIENSAGETLRDKLDRGLSLVARFNSQPSPQGLRAIAAALTKPAA